jgi:hypothetical protein
MRFRWTLILAVVALVFMAAPVGADVDCAQKPDHPQCAGYQEPEITRVLKTFVGGPATTYGASFQGIVACPLGTSIIGGGVTVGGDFQKWVVSRAGMVYNGITTNGGQYEARITLIFDDPGTRPVMNVMAICASGITVTDIFL